MTEQTLTAAENEAVSDLVREALARRRITRRYLADQAKISLSTLEKALSGQRPFTLASIVRLEAALGVTLRKSSPAKSAAAARYAGIAPEELGSYGRAAISWIEGDYVTVRPSFSIPESLYAYRTTISWSDERSHLVFKESERIDAAFTQEGNVSIPHQSGYIYLVTSKAGQYRLVIISRPTIAGEMFGIVTTLQSGRGTHLLPVATPVALVPMKNFAGDAAFGRIDKGHGFHGRYRGLIDRTVEEPFALLIPR
jgi:hypothetical protein